MEYNYNRDIVIGFQPPRPESGDSIVNVSEVAFLATEDLGAYAGASEYPDYVTKNGITIAVSPKGSFGNAKQYRIYQGSSFMVSSTIGNIAKIEMVCENEDTKKYGPGHLKNPTSGTYAYDGYVGTWTGDTTEITFDACASQVRLLRLTIFLKDETEPAQNDTIPSMDNGNTTALFDATDDLGSQPASSFEPDEMTKDGVTIKVSPMGSFGNGQNYRVYQGSDLTFSTDVGNIVKVVVTCIEQGDKKYGPGCMNSPSEGNYTYEDNIGTWTGFTNSFTLAAVRQVRMTQIDVVVSQVSPKKGDVDIDGRISISDVMMTMNYVLGKHPAGFAIENADVNNDGVVNISDVMSIANIVVASQDNPQ